ncbi:MAG: DUF229 domain-containing protein, partial [Lentisphaerae bacterium]
PQRYSIFTGRLPCTRFAADPAHKPTISLGNIARHAGYNTFYYGKWHITSRVFSREDVTYHGFTVNKGGHDQRTAQAARELFGSYREKAPFFACFSFYNPHDICQWGRKVSGIKERIRMKNGELPIDPPLSKCPPLPPNFSINPDEAEAVRVRRTIGSAQAMAMKWDKITWRRYLWAYYRLVELADKRIGEVLEALRKNGFLENTVIIFTSDHGDGMACHRWHQKSILYENSVRVPFIISWPGKGRQAAVDHHLISTGIDMMPTLCDIVGYPMPEGPYYGKSAILFVLSGENHAPTHSYVVSEANVSDPQKGVYVGRAIRSPRYKYHVWSKGAHREQLFDMQTDPGETHNLAKDPAYADILQQHRAYFADWLRRTDDTWRQDIASASHLHSQQEE